MTSPGIGPSRILGPQRSCKTATCCPISLLIRRMSARTSECSSCVPCEKFRRKTSTPATINFRRTSGDRDAGPIVATIFVRLGGRSVSRLPIMSGQSQFGSSTVVLQLVERFPNNCCALSELSLLDLAQWQWKCLDDARPAHQSRQCNGDIFDPGHVLGRRTNCQDRSLVVKHRIDNPG